MKTKNDTGQNAHSEWSNVRKILDTSQPRFKIVALFLNIGKLKAGIGQLLPEVVVIYKSAAIAFTIVVMHDTGS
jgi:hypothetical protein